MMGSNQKSLINKIKKKKKRDQITLETNNGEQKDKLSTSSLFFISLVLQVFSAIIFFVFINFSYK